MEMIAKVEFFDRYNKQSLSTLKLKRKHGIDIIRLSWGKGKQCE